MSAPAWSLSFHCDLILLCACGLAIFLEMAIATLCYVTLRTSNVHEVPAKGAPENSLTIFHISKLNSRRNVVFAQNTAMH